MRANRYVITAAAVAAVLVLALIASFSLRTDGPVAASQSASPTVTLSPSASASATPSTTARATSLPSATNAGTITGALGYPAEMVPPLTVYAISVNEPSVWFSVDTPQFGGEPRPGTPTAAPGQRVEYAITGVAPGTYYAVAYFQIAYFRSLPAGSVDRPAIYSRYTVECIQATQGGQSSTPAPACGANPQDHTLIPITVRAGETVARIDMTDWGYRQAMYPPRPTPR